jgi:hypothetical protein
MLSSRSREKVLGGLRIGRILFIGIGDNLGYLVADNQKIHDSAVGLPLDTDCLLLSHSASSQSNLFVL